MLALPLLDCMRPRQASAADKVLNPKRSVFIYLPNGVNTVEWQIREAGADYKLSAPLVSLEKHRGQFTPISGVHHPMGSAITTTASRSG